ncbi:hypothetical protein CCACVL1_28011 [Corchorus capsularis]|uniref:Nucleic acid-binding protein n=1 Tax=Corchorus capsularis TaxID=210143 RepID=A0A1R3G7V8_COCAP|nr:hypothetical protein CCACVL1_28011 [Corchorus capsularis]
MRAIISKDLLDDFDHVIRKGHVYKVVRFPVLPSRETYRCVNSHNELHFNSTTELEPISEGVNEFPRFWFSLASMDEINTRGPGHPLLTDVAGMLLSLTDVVKIEKSTGEIKENKDIVIRLIGGHELTVNFWEHHIHKLVPDQLLGHVDGWCSSS